MQVCQEFSHYIPHHVLHLYRRVHGGIWQLSLLPRGDQEDDGKQCVQGQPGEALFKILDARLADHQILDLGVPRQHPPH